MNIFPTAVAQAYSFERKTSIASREESPFAAANVRNGGDVSVSISAAGRQAAAASETRAYDTSGGTMGLDIDAYFSAGTNRAEASLRDLPPLLLPSQNNIDALASHISAKMPAFLADHGIPAAPERITYDNAGQMQLPADYPYAEEFKQALADVPVLERQLRTVNALSSHVAEMAKSLPFQQEYAAATTQAEADAVVAKYVHLFSGTRQYDEIALLFAADGRLTVINATQNVALSTAAT